MWSTLAQSNRRNRHGPGYSPPVVDGSVNLAATSGEMAALVPALGRRSLFSSARAPRLLDWHPPPARDAVIAAGQSILADMSQRSR